MQTMGDMELLKEYASRHSEAAFAALVSRHVDLVYSAALRHTGGHHQAEEVTQAVFIILARKARSLSSGTVLAGWLFRTARLAAANYVRSEMRRVRREQEAYMQSNPSENPGDPWREVAPALNDAIGDLGEKDRDAIVLRFLKGKGYREVAAEMGGSEEAAQMRVSRALEKLRKMFAKRGVVLTVAALGGLMTAQGTQAAPVGLAASIAATAIQGTALTASSLALVEKTLKIMAWTKAKFAVGASVLVLLAYQYHQNSVQAQQLVSARQVLSGQREAVEVQDSRIVELERQTAAIVETRREQEQELARLRARRRNAPGSGQSAAAAGIPTTLLSATLSDPDARESMRVGLVAGLKFRWGPVFEGSRLQSQDAEKLLQIGGDSLIKNLETVAAFTDGKVTAEAAVQATDQKEQDATNKVRLLLGDEGFAKFEECQRTYPARSLIQQFDKQLGYFAISTDQRSRLVEIIKAEPYEVTRGLAGDFTTRDVVFPDEMTRRFEQQAEENRRILEDAADFLAADQLEALRLMQVNNMSTQKRNLLRMLRKL